MDDLKELLYDIGEVVEASGRMLQRKPPLTHEDLTRLHNTLTSAAEVVQTARDLQVQRNN